MEDNYYDYTFNITLVGDCGVGKTNIGSMFVDNEFISDHWFTLGVLIKNKIIKLDNSIIKLKILCTSSNEEFRSESLMHYIRGGQCIFVVFDLTKLETFTNIHIWLHEIKKYNDDIQFIDENIDENINDYINDYTIDDYIIKNNDL